MGNNQGSLKEGQILSIPKTDYAAEERPYFGPPVHYHIVAGGQTSDVVFPLIEESYKKGWQLLVFRKKPACRYFVGIFREPFDAMVGFDGASSHPSRTTPRTDTSLNHFKAKNRFHEFSNTEERTYTSRISFSEQPLSYRQEWQCRVMSLWLHGQHQRLPKGKDGTKRDVWVADHFCLADVLSKNLHHGERLVCLSMATEQKVYFKKDIPVGMTLTPGVTKTVWCQNQDRLPFDQRKLCNAITVNLVYEIPLHRPYERFVYSVVPVPVTINHKRPDTGVMGHRLGLATITCDWSGTLNHHLSFGWRLVDLLVDFRPPPEKVDDKIDFQLMTQFQYRCGTGDGEYEVSTWNPIDTHTIWIFEKPASREQDHTPAYEGKVVPFAFKYTGLDSAVCWDDEIRSMGSRGWELACFVERASYWPVKETAGSPVASVVQSLLFFQRPLNYLHASCTEHKA